MGETHRAERSESGFHRMSRLTGRSTMRAFAIGLSLFGVALLGGAIYVGWYVGQGDVISILVWAGGGIVIFAAFAVKAWEENHTVATSVTVTDRGIEAQTMVKGRDRSLAWSDIDEVRKYKRRAWMAWTKPGPDYPRGETVRLVLVSRTRGERIRLLGIREGLYLTLPGLSDFDDLVDFVERHTKHARWSEHHA